MIRTLAALFLTLSFIAPAAAQPVNASAPQTESRSVPKALVVVGPWGDLFRWREALHAEGVIYDEAYRAMNVYHGGVRVYGLPQTAEQLAAYSTVVLVNVDAPCLGEKWLGLLPDFVRGGGGLVVLGGEWAFRRGGYAGTPLEALLPVDMPDEARIPVDRAGALLRLPEKSTWSEGLAFDAAPRCFYAQTLTPRADAVVELLVGDRPALIRSTQGDGRTVACGLTIHGRAADGVTPFWEWADWPRLLGRAVDWSAGNKRATAATPSAVKPLSDAEIAQVQARFDPLTAEFADRFAAFPSAAAATTLFEQLFADKPTRITLSPPLVAALVKFVQPEWEKPLLKWSDSLNPEAAHRNAAIELLGASRGPAAGERLLELLADVDAGPAALDGLRRLDDPRNVPLLQSLFERSVAAADFRAYGTPSANTPLSLRNGILAVRAAAALYALGDPQGTARLAGLYREIRLLRRIHANAAKRRVSDTDAQGQGIRAAIIKKADDFRALEAYLLDVAGPVPPRQRAAFVDYAVTAADDAEVRFLWTALLHSPTDDWSKLAAAQDGIVRRFANLKP